MLIFFCLFFHSCLRFKFNTQNRLSKKCLQGVYQSIESTWNSGMLSYTTKLNQSKLILLATKSRPEIQSERHKYENGKFEWKLCSTQLAKRKTARLASVGNFLLVVPWLKKLLVIKKALSLAIKHTNSARTQLGAQVIH